jgi:hypothetical protein
LFGYREPGSISPRTIDTKPRRELLHVFGKAKLGNLKRPVSEHSAEVVVDDHLILLENVNPGILARIWPDTSPEKAPRTLFS